MQKLGEEVFHMIKEWRDGVRLEQDEGTWSEMRSERLNHVRL